jgi:hypothetical protein
LVNLLFAMNNRLFYPVNRGFGSQFKFRLDSGRLSPKR